MNSQRSNLQRKLFWMLAGCLSVLPSAGYSLTGPLADQPLWVSATVKNNVIMAIDDSGSMDFELLFPTEHGMLYVGDDGKFTSDDNGTLLSGFGTYSAYGYLFPNGQNSTYDGSRLYNVYYAVPPVRAYAFARSADYNQSFYDPDVSYEPWPSYGGFDFPDASTTATPFEPSQAGAASSPGTLNLFADFTPSGTYWGFDVADGDMVCDNSGNTCGSYQLDRKTGFTYYPATYYVKDTESSFEYDGKPIHTENARLVEAEDGTYLSPFANDTDISAKLTDGSTEKNILEDAQTEGGETISFVGTVQGAATASDSPPTEGGVSYAINIPASDTVKIWFRIYAPSNDQNSFWVNLRGYGSADITPSDTGNTWSGDWNKFWNNIPAPTTWSTSVDWQWVEWGEVTVAAGDHELNVLRREAGTYIDQVLVTNNLTYVPTEAIELTDPDDPVACSASTGEYYGYFFDDPSKFTFTDADGGSADFAIGIDGSCLKEYKITGTNTASFDNGSDVRTSVTVAEEKQNFANWFTYHRRRHQAMRGGLADAMESVTGIQTGLFWVNDRSDVTMYDMSDKGNSGDVHDFLTEHYGHVRTGGTALRSALKYAGDQYKRTDSGAPITEECQKNFTLLFTDGYNSELSISDIDHEDQTADSPYSDAYADTLGDIAYKYYTETLRTGTGFPEGEVDVHQNCGEEGADPSLDCNRNLHMNTYTVSLGVEGTIFGETHFEVSDAYETTPTWPDVNQAADKRQVDDLYHAAVNGRGEMFSATSTSELATELRLAMQDILASVGSGSGVTFNTSSLQSSGTKLIYSTEFNSTNWTGNIRARKVASDGSVGDAVWIDSDADAEDNDGVKHALEDKDYDTRVVFTKGTSDGVAFRYANLTDAQKNDLKYGETSTVASDIQATIEARIDYIRGDTSNAAYRNRDYILGDIVHSAPVFVGEPASNWPDDAPFGSDTARFSTYKKSSAANRSPTIYVGANDGMLHGFNANSSGTGAGEEVLAYVPGLVYSDSASEGLHYLTDPNYVHRYYVDLTPIAQDVYMKGSSTDTDQAWRTVLVGGLRGGGKGLFALDVTDPTKFTESGTNPADVVLWEFNDDAASGADMGYLTTPPIIAMMNNGEWAVIFGNGYSSDNGDAVLFIVYMEQGIDGTWSASDYKKITVADDTGNGLSGVAVADTTGDSVADRIYAGDLKGQMWAFDVSDTNPTNWEVAHTVKISGTDYNAPLFTATDSSGTAQPITGAPNLAYNTNYSNSQKAPNILVTFGTGQYLVDSDPTDQDVQSYYTVWDTGSGAMDRDDLEPRTLVTGSNGQLTMTGSDISWSQDDGWYFDFLNGSTAEGERLTHKPLVVPDGELGPVAIFASTIPETVDACDAGGRSNLYLLPLLTGLNPDRGLADLDGDGDIDDDDIGVGIQKEDLINEPNKLGNVLFGSKGKGKDVDVTETTLEGGSTREGRLGWHEIIDN